MFYDPLFPITLFPAKTYSSVEGLLRMTMGVHRGLSWVVAPVTFQKVTESQGFSCFLGEIEYF